MLTKHNNQTKDDNGEQTQQLRVSRKQAEGSAFIVDMPEVEQMRNHLDHIHGRQLRDHQVFRNLVKGQEKRRDQIRPARTLLGSGHVENYQPLNV